ncbi:MAG: hypothetical protein MJ170_00015 [Alphaproteobacteria bacterium]|nr:hypothetical protein [Alphaproteobacteria bacterium]
MKKIALTSLLAMVAATAANANVINGNPLYKPAAGHFASVTSLETSMFESSDSIKSWGLGEEFAYGITDNLTIGMETSAARLIDTAIGYNVDMETGAIENVDGNATLWMDFGLSLNYRVFNIDGWVLDAAAGYAVSPVGYRVSGFSETHSGFLDKESTDYSWKYGVSGGYMGETFTVAGHVYTEYLNSESFNWGDDGVHTIDLGIDGQYILTDWLNLVAGIGYTGVLDSEAENAGSWTGMLGANFNIDETKFIGVYATTGLEHENGDSSWKLQKSMGLGVKFGIDF